MMLSVRLQCYNHADYIEQALNSIISQKTNFPFEVVIGDDFSTDNSLDIIRNAIKENTNSNISFHLLDRRTGDTYYKNRQIKGRLYNFLDILNNCKGKYIALLDGDDYWVDPLKLQKQVDFLEANEDYVMCYHNAKIVDENSHLVKESRLPLESQIDFDSFQLKTNPYILTLSVCFRNLIKELPPEMYIVLNGDTFLFSILGQYGKGKYMDSIKDAAYREHSKSVWSSLSREKKNIALLKTTVKLKEYFNRINDKECVFVFENRIKQFSENILLSDKSIGKKEVLLILAKDLHISPIIWFILYTISHTLFNKGYYFKRKLIKSI